MKVVHINSNSLVPHVPEFRYLANNFSSHVIAVSETWGTDRVADSLVDITNYSLIRNDKEIINLDSYRDTMGGGVALYIFTIHYLLVVRYLLNLKYREWAKPNIL